MPASRETNGRARLDGCAGPRINARYIWNKLGATAAHPSTLFDQQVALVDGVDLDLPTKSTGVNSLALRATYDTQSMPAKLPRDNEE